MLLGKQRFDHSQSWINLTDPAGSSLQPATPSFPSPRALIWKGSIRSREGRRNGSRGQALFEHVSTDDCWAFQEGQGKTICRTAFDWNEEYHQFDDASATGTGTGTIKAPEPEPPEPEAEPSQARKPEASVFLLVLHTKDKGSFASKAQSQHTAAIEDLPPWGLSGRPCQAAQELSASRGWRCLLLPGNNARGSQAVRLRFAVFLGQAQLNSKL